MAQTDLQRELKNRKQREYAKQFPERTKGATKRWLAANREHIRQYRRDVYKKNAALILAKQKARMTPEKKLKKAEYYARWKKLNSEKVAAYAKQYRHDNAEQLREHMRQDYRLNLSKRRASNKAWRNANREKMNAYSSKRRARKKASSISPDANKAILHIRKKDRVSCFHCGKTIRGTECHMDHLFPLSKGGPHQASNLVPSCPGCNSSKQDTLPNDFIKKGQLVLL